MGEIRDRGVGVGWSQGHDSNEQQSVCQSKYNNVSTFIHKVSCLLPEKETQWLCCIIFHILAVSSSDPGTPAFMSATDGSVSLSKFLKVNNTLPTCNDVTVIKIRLAKLLLLIMRVRLCVGYKNLWASCMQWAAFVHVHSTCFYDGKKGRVFHTV